MPPADPISCDDLLDYFQIARPGEDSPLPVELKNIHDIYLQLYQESAQQIRETIDFEHPAFSQIDDPVDRARLAAEMSARLRTGLERLEERDRQFLSECHQVLNSSPSCTSDILAIAIDRRARFFLDWVVDNPERESQIDFFEWLNDNVPYRPAGPMNSLATDYARDLHRTYRDRYQFDATALSRLLDAMLRGNGNSEANFKSALSDLRIKQKDLTSRISDVNRRYYHLLLNLLPTHDAFAFHRFYLSHAFPSCFAKEDSTVRQFKVALTACELTPAQASELETLRSTYELHVIAEEQKLLRLKTDTVRQRIGANVIDPQSQLAAIKLHKKQIETAKANLEQERIGAENMLESVLSATQVATLHIHLQSMDHE